MTPDERALLIATSKAVEKMVNYQFGKQYGEEIRNALERLTAGQVVQFNYNLTNVRTHLGHQGLDAFPPEQP